jgi:outer membrane biosynthesis protein TonB
VLPKQPVQQPKPKPKAETKPDPKPEPKPVERKEVVIDPAPKQEKDLDDLLADFREEQGEPAPAAAPATAAVPTPGVPGGTARVSPEVADWMRRAKIHVKRNWVVAPGFRNEPLRTYVVVKLDAQGNVVGTPEITQRSGNPWYDEGVVRGIQKASPLPAPPEAGEWDFVFLPEDGY